MAISPDHHLTCIQQVVSTMVSRPGPNLPLSLGVSSFPQAREPRRRRGKLLVVQLLMSLKKGPQVV